VAIGNQSGLSGEELLKQINEASSISYKPGQIEFKRETKTNGSTSEKPKEILDVNLSAEAKSNTKLRYLELHAAVQIFCDGHTHKEMGVLAGRRSDTNIYLAETVAIAREKGVRIEYSPRTTEEAVAYNNAQAWAQQAKFASANAAAARVPGQEVGKDIELGRLVEDSAPVGFFR
jgi:hypothetical protein